VAVSKAQREHTEITENFYIDNYKQFTKKQSSVLFRLIRVFRVLVGLLIQPHVKLASSLKVFIIVLH